MTLQGETIIYFGPEPWAGLWRNRHQLMSRFAEDNDVWYVEPAAPIRDVLALKRRNLGLFRRDASGVNVFRSPCWLPVTGRAPFKSASIRIYLWVLSLVARARGGRRPIVWYSRPEFVDYLGMLASKLSVYHVVDEYSGYGHPSKTASASPNTKEARMLEAADIVIVVTQSLFESKSPHNPNTHVVMNAVDFEAYTQCNEKVPDDMAGLTGPIIGYSGLVAARLDLEMLADAATLRPEWNFVFVGTVNEQYCESEIEHLRKLPNVMFLGYKPVDDVPQYVNHFDVCIIPYVVNLRAKHAGPLKMYEYAAASKPIVTTDFEAARTFEGRISIASDTNSFVRECQHSLDQRTTGNDIAENRRIASENTWAHRITQLSDILRSAGS